MSVFYLLIPSVLIALAFSIRWKIEKSGLFGLLLGVAFSVSVIWIIVILENHGTWWLWIYIGVSVITATAMLADTFFWNDRFIKIYYYSGGITFIFLLVHSIYLLSPALRGDSIYSPPKQSFEHQIEESTEKIIISLNEFENSIAREARNIETFTHSLKRAVETQDEKIRLLKKEKQRLTSQIEYYKQISSLSKEQVDAIKKNLDEDKITDHIIGFISGFISSVVFALLVYFSKKVTMRHRKKSLQ